MYDCQKVMERLYHYLDRELSEGEVEEVQRHLDACPPCRDRFTFEENVLRLVGDCARHVTAPPELVERVRRLCDQD
ncbi:MAG: mycothiol system anti-sigma-R factor [Thermomicrobiaceae bacterium]|nr:mycothiol system anti-sigma-R factor [Thermomicrobiaceae bacterium]